LNTYLKAPKSFQRFQTGEKSTIKYTPPRRETIKKRDRRELISDLASAPAEDCIIRRGGIVRVARLGSFKINEIEKQ